MNKQKKNKAAVSAELVTEVDPFLAKVQEIRQSIADGVARLPRRKAARAAKADTTTAAETKPKKAKKAKAPAAQEGTEAKQPAQMAVYASVRGYSGHPHGQMRKVIKAEWFPGSNLIEVYTLECGHNVIRKGWGNGKHAGRPRAVCHLCGPKSAPETKATNA